MTKKRIIVIIIFSILIIGGVIAYKAITSPNNIVIAGHMILKKHYVTNPHMNQENNLDKTNHKTSGKFSESEYAPVCWEVAPQDPSTNAQTALFGIAMKKQKNSDGSFDVGLRPDSSEYTWKTIHVQTGFTLYFCDYTDDDEEIGMTDKDITSNKDDFPVLVDSQGNIVPGQNLPDMANVQKDFSNH